MGVAAPRRRSLDQAVASQQISDTLLPSSQHQTQPSETSATLSSVTVTQSATTFKATPSLPTKLLERLDTRTPPSFSAPVFAATQSSSHSSAVALGIVFGVFFGTIIFSFIIWRLCRRASSPPKSSASTWPSSSSSAKATIMPVSRYSSTMRYPHRPTPARVKSGDDHQSERAMASEKSEKMHASVKPVKVIQSGVPPPPPHATSQRDSSHPVLSHETKRTRHRRDTSAPRLHPGRQAVVDVSSPTTTEKWDDHHGIRRERSKRNTTDHATDRPQATRNNMSRPNSPHDLNPPPMIYVAGRTVHERDSRRSRERELLQDPDAHAHAHAHNRQPSPSRRRIRRSQPTSINIIHESTPEIHTASASAPALSTATSTSARRYQPPRYDSGSASSLTSSSSSDTGSQQSEDIGEQEPPYLTTSSSSSSSSDGGGRRERGRGSWERRSPRSRSRSRSGSRSRSQNPEGRVRFTLPEGVGRYLDDS